MTPLFDESVYEQQNNHTNNVGKRVIPVESHECCDKMCDSMTWTTALGAIKLQQYHMSDVRNVWFHRLVMLWFWSQTFYHKVQDAAQDEESI